ncbi:MULTISPECIES: class I SAM-dependent methyltransferase [Streptomyces]|uniref:Methyltransferase domain-containing protein n=1 Tax=Streptomyces lycii TaxID=2654337 RepID=A0ABQ7FMX7_9ACTN|nr:MULTISPECIES: class I SAM-dependent methyltransferase [Streptomyces]KAF4409760.1 methyltransferase domain-containing protein [Streptomyces lycii]PGH47508.1 SAM-dependent methyltransferase [Streptomyces sp. Ru87]
MSGTDRPASKFDDPAFFGHLWADAYDESTDLDPTEAVDFLAALADGGPALELAVGTGRVALPLARRGVEVTGVDASRKMIDKMLAKPDGGRVEAVVGDLTDVPAEGPFRLVYLVYNTLFNLRDADKQAACFRNVARVLEPGGAFVIECYVPDPPYYDQSRQLSVREVTEDSATIDLHAHDRNAQTFMRQSITFDADGVHLLPHSERYCWPNELDLMASLAGLRLTERYAGWGREPFGPESRDHISVYRAPS